MVISEDEPMLRRLLRDVKLTNRLDPLLGFVRARLRHLRQVIMNLR